MSNYPESDQPGSQPYYFSLEGGAYGVPPSTSPDSQPWPSQFISAVQPPSSRVICQPIPGSMYACSSAGQAVQGYAHTDMSGQVEPPYVTTGAIQSASSFPGFYGRTGIYGFNTSACDNDRSLYQPPGSMQRSHPQDPPMAYGLSQSDMRLAPGYLPTQHSASLPQPQNSRYVQSGQPSSTPTQLRSTQTAARPPYSGVQKTASTGKGSRPPSINPHAVASRISSASSPAPQRKQSCPIPIVLAWTEMPSQSVAEIGREIQNYHMATQADGVSHVTVSSTRDERKKKDSFVVRYNKDVRTATGDDALRLKGASVGSRVQFIGHIGESEFAGKTTLRAGKTAVLLSRPGVTDDQHLSVFYRQCPVDLSAVQHSRSNGSTYKLDLTFHPPRNRKEETFTIHGRLIGGRPTGGRSIATFEVVQDPNLAKGNEAISAASAASAGFSG